MSPREPRTDSTTIARVGPPRLRPAAHRRRRYLVAGVILLVLGVIAAVATAPAWYGRFCLDRAAKAIGRQDFAAADTWLQRARAVPAEGPRTEFLLARMNRKLGRLDLMADHLVRAGVLGWDSHLIEREQWYADAQAGAPAALEARLSQLLVAGDDLPEVCEAFVCGCLLTYRLDDAVQILDLWQADFSDDPQPHFLRGRILEHRLALERAAAEYREALRLAPRHAPAAFNLGRVLVTLQQPAAALDAYDRCAQFHLAPQPGLVGKAHCLRLLGRFDEARNCLQTALAAPAEQLEAAYRLVGEPLEKARSQTFAEFGLLELAQENYSAAAEHLANALDANPHDWRARYSLATALRQLGKTGEAAAHMEKVEETKAALAECDPLIDRLRTHPDDVAARLHIGKTFLQHVSENQGVIWLKSVLAIDEHHAEAHRLLADYYERRASESREFATLAEQQRRAANLRGD